MTKKLQIDRIEGKFAVMTDDEEIYNIPADFFGENAREGNIFEVVFENGKPVSAVFLAEETEAVREKIRKLMAKLRNKK
ncbi:MAG: DUF3006 domain-containing protein [Clostridia bacterium]|nr:DUF3006 domain-containing protein [Clostridia bacterium]